MERRIVINGFNINPYLFQPFSDGIQPVEILKGCLSDLPYDGTIIELHPEGSEYSLGYEKVITDTPDIEGFWAKIIELVPSNGELLLLQADQPLLDIPMLEDMMDLFNKYFAEYTFADAWPIGLAGEIVRGNILKQVRTLAAGNRALPESGTLFSLIQKDINQFDLETLVAPMDFRPWRLDFSIKNREGWLLVDRLRKGNYRNSKDLEKWIKTNEKLLRTVPSYVQIQVNDACAQSCTYCPYPKVHNPVTQKARSMSLDEFSGIIDELKDLNPQAVVSLSPWGEPSLNPAIIEMIEKVLQTPSLKLLIETSGLGWDKQKLAPYTQSKRIDWVVSLDSFDPEVYRELRGEGHKEALDFISFLEEKNPERLYIQIVRMKENDESLEMSFKLYQERKAHLIVQKYDHFCGFLEEKKITDLSPVKRNPCWHNKRDMIILTDGRVPCCKEDVEGKEILGNLFEESLETLWNKGQELYIKQINKEYPGICGNCDEYYTYNF